MKLKSLMIIGLLSLSVLFSAKQQVFCQDEVMNNEEVISLVKAGLSSSIIVNKIRTSKTNFDLSTNSLISLKKSGVSDDVVNAMLESKNGKSMSMTPSGSNNTSERGTGDPNDPMSLHNYGLYLYEEKDGNRKMIPLQPNVSAQNRTGGGFTAAVTPFGLGKVKTKANLPGRNAALQFTTTKPVFYFYLDKSSGGLNTASGIPSTPNEFVLVRFNQRSDNREVTIAKANAWGAKGGLSDEYVVQFDAQDLGNGIFKITPSGEMKKGEYAFYLVNSGNSNASAAIGAKFFDFGVLMNP